jgi:hypothetical protein
MKHRLCVLSAVLAVALLSGMAWGYPTRFTAMTGLVDLPTADVAASGSAELAADYAKLAGEEQVWPMRVLAGVSDSAELGIAYTRLKDGVNDHFTGIGAKVALMKAETADFGLAFGGSYVNGTGDNILDLYAVASKEIATAAPEAYMVAAPRARLRGHLGLMFTRVSNGRDDDELKPFVGFDVTTPDGAALVAEYKWSKFGADQAAAAIRYPVSPAMTVQAGAARAGSVLGQDDYRFTVGLSYAFATAGGTGAAY